MLNLLYVVYPESGVPRQTYVFIYGRDFRELYQHGFTVNFADVWGAVESVTSIIYTEDTIIVQVPWLNSGQGSITIDSKDGFYHLGPVPFYIKE